MAESQPLILYVPGLRPKPEPEAHRRQLFRCLLAGMDNIGGEASAFLRDHEHCFDLVSWTYDFYGEYRDLELDMPGIEALLSQHDASSQDRAEAGAFIRRFRRAMYRALDHLPFLIPHFADEEIEIQLRDLRRYVKNENEIAILVRQLLQMPLRAAEQAGRAVLLIGHSMGSVIAYDSLWHLSQNEAGAGADAFMTMGSPLGQRYIQSRLLGARESGPARFPSNLKHWINISAVGELTAIDMRLENDFGEMRELGLLESFGDHEIFNWFRLDGELNVHAEYGYLINPLTARIVSNWIRAHL